VRSLGAGLALLSGTLMTTVVAVLLARPLLPAFELRRSLAASALCGLGCLILGMILSPVVGEIAATSVAVSVLTAVAIYAEYDTAKDLLRGLAGDFKVMTTRTDVST